MIKIGWWDSMTASHYTVLVNTRKKKMSNELILYTSVRDNPASKPEVESRIIKWFGGETPIKYGITYITCGIYDNSQISYKSKVKS